jgi:hypothetical protein
MALSVQLLTQVQIVVNLPVERDPNGLVFVGERLPASFQVDDAETAMG